MFCKEQLHNVQVLCASKEDHLLMRGVYTVEQINTQAINVHKWAAQSVCIGNRSTRPACRLMVEWSPCQTINHFLLNTAVYTCGGCVSTGGSRHVTSELNNHLKSLYQSLWWVWHESTICFSLLYCVIVHLQFCFPWACFTTLMNANFYTIHKEWHSIATLSHGYCLTVSSDWIFLVGHG